MNYSWVLMYRGHAERAGVFIEGFVCALPLLSRLDVLQIEKHITLCYFKNYFHSLRKKCSYIMNFVFCKPCSMTTLLKYWEGGSFLLGFRGKDIFLSALSIPGNRSRSQTPGGLGGAR